MHAEADEEEEREKLANSKKSCWQYLIIHPEKSVFKTFWDAYIYIGLAFNFFLIPFTLAFDTESVRGRILDMTNVWELIYDISFMCHIILNFFTAY